MVKGRTRKLEALFARMECPKGCRCLSVEPHRLCKAEDFGNERYLACLEDDAHKCAFFFAFGRTVFYRCPLRRHLAETAEEAEKRRKTERSEASAEHEE